MIYTQINPPDTTVAELITLLKQMPQGAYVRVERPGGWDDPRVVLVAGHTFGFTEGNLVTL